jgi:membrane protease YdiL (CAAX protease family)
MSAPSEATPPAETPAIRKQSKGQLALIWAAIIAGVGFMLWYRTHHPVEYTPDEAEQAAYVVMQMQARYLVGATELLNLMAEKSPGLQGMMGTKQSLYSQAESLNTGPIGQRLRFIPLAGELAGPGEALKQLRLLEEKAGGDGVRPSPTEAHLIDIMRRIYTDYTQANWTAASVSRAERLELEAQLGWFGQLALAPAGAPDPSLRAAMLASARRTAQVIIGTVVVLGVLGLIGSVALIILLTFLFSGRITPGVQVSTTHGAVYAEAFALWLLVFFAISLAAGRWLPRTGPFLLFSGLLELLSLGALFWPVVRGLPWHEVRREVGLHAGRRPLLEPLIGIANYAMTLPFLALGVAIMLAIILSQQRLTGQPVGGNDFSPTNLPSHPFVPYLVTADWRGRIQVLLLASVVAPIVEETLFRGVLYRHLREISSRFAYPVSVGLGALVVSFIFAVIHPQGLVAVPALMGIAFGLTLVREWRGTLIPGIITHGINNALVVCFTIGALSS